MAPIIMTDAADGPCAEERHENPRRLQELAHWYREFADRAGHLGGAIEDGEGIGAGGRSVGRSVGARPAKVTERGRGGSITRLRAGSPAAQYSENRVFGSR